MLLWPRASKMCKMAKNVPLFACPPSVRTFVTNTKPRAGRSATDLLIDMLGKEPALAGRCASRVAGLVREMGTLEEMGVDIRSLFSEL